MNNPALAWHTAPDRKSGWSRYSSVVFVAAFHVVAIWALVTGLGVKIDIPVIPVMHTKVIDTQQPQHPQPLPPVNPIVTRTVAMPYIPAPIFQVARDSNPTSIQETTQQQTQQQSVVVEADTPASAITATHTTPPYPALARRLDRQGTVTLLLAIGADGGVVDAQVATSSGDADLDQAAVSWVKTHWRYKPALQGGVAVASTGRAAVRFDLKTAQ